ncbi:NgoFVII restriction endonuclease [Algoriella xinjiangensis]|uniref:NgoFVII restriction endonuclease n=1 Tax=Algoriella xinjiangensis TaxID=684065 RepID=A0A1I4WHV1_9FLAO|nr:NgoFVII restriction endonuclease [Algoriella xinjiangensis]VDH16930.1 Predicted HKD family nuclease [Algoriella xinjiangensis]
MTRNNHFSELNNNFENAVEVVIISPFISNSTNFFPFDKIKNLQKLTIVTTLKPNDLDQYTKVPFFKELFTKFETQNIELIILIENSLHGKIYISKYSDKSAKAIITSANFTNNGLRLNNEWGTTIEDIETINQIEIGIIGKVIHIPISKNQVDDFLKILQENPLPKVGNNLPNLNLSKNLVIKNNPFQIQNNATFWLKPIGVSNDLISIDRVFDEVDSDLHFSKLKPKGVKKNDILITYAVGHLNILSIYRVKSEIKNTEIENDRWPFYVIGENLTPFYGQNWSKQNITITNQKNEVLDKVLFDITPSGKNSFGSLMRGADKLKLTPEFGQYIVNKIIQIDSEIKNYG